MSAKITQERWVYGPASNYEGFYIAPASCLPTLAAVQVGCRLNDGSRSHVNTVTCFNFPGQTEDIARLIASAPELLEALRTLVRATATTPGTHGLAIDNARAAIAKATGAQP